MFEGIINLDLLKAAFTRFHAAIMNMFAQRKRVTITLPAGVTSYIYSDNWITADTDCYGHDMATKNAIDTNVSWVFNNGSVTFTFGHALSESVGIKFGMVKGEVNG